MSAGHRRARRSRTAGLLRSYHVRRLLVAALITAGVIQLAIVGLAYVRSWLLERETRPVSTRTEVPGATLARAAAAREAAVRSGTIGHLEIPRLGLEAPVVEGIDTRSLLGGVGHVPASAFPGERDNLALAGHRDTHFAPLRDIERGDRIRIDTPDGEFVYVVDSTLIVPPTRGDLIEPTGKPTITLVTCYPFHWMGPAPKRFVVRGHVVAETTAAELPQRS